MPSGKAARFLINYMWDQQYGGLYQGVDPTGKVVNDRKESYAAAAAILGMARAAEITGEKNISMPRCASCRPTRRRGSGTSMASSSAIPRGISR